MSSSHWIHDLIKAQIALKSANSTENIALLDDLKQIFYDEIGSERRFACINSFDDLLDVLESRGTFTEKEMCSAMDNIKIMTDLNANEGFAIELFDQKRENIYNFIGSFIGDKWIEFGQQLNIRDDILDDLKKSENNISNNINKILEIYETERQNNDKKIISGICTALRECKCNEICQYVRNAVCLR